MDRNNKEWIIGADMQEVIVKGKEGIVALKNGKFKWCIMGCSSNSSLMQFHSSKMIFVVSDCSKITAVHSRTQLILFNIDLKDTMYSNKLFWYADKFIYYVSSRLELKMFDLRKKKAVQVRSIEAPLKLFFAGFRHKATTEIGVQELKFEGVSVQHEHSTEVAVLWGTCRDQSFILIFWKKLVAFRLAVFDMMSHYMKKIEAVQILPSDALHYQTAESRGHRYLLIIGGNKICTFRLRELAETRFTDYHTPNSSLDFQFSSNL